jgi:membrane associated rhomboid family serine protease
VILPIGDEPNPRGTPWVNYALLAVNVGVFVVVTLPLMMRPADPNDPLTQALLRALIEANPEADPRDIAYHLLKGRTAYDMFLLRWGYRPGDPSVLALFSSMFLHGGWAHLLGNMLFLWIYGDNVEHALGRFGYLAAYLATGVLAAVGYGVVAPAAQGHIPMVGASGAISGVLGFYFIWFPRNRVRLLFFPFFFFIWKIQARWVLGFYLIVDNLLPFLIQPRGEGGGVAYGAHIGGFVGGVVGALALDRWSRFRGRRTAACCEPEERDVAEETPSIPERRSAPLENIALDTPGLPTPVVELMLDIKAARHADAIRRYLALSSFHRRRVPVAVVAHLADWLANAGQADAALALYRQAVDDNPRGPGLDRLFLGIGLVLLHGKGRPTAAFQYLLDALDASPSPEVAAEARAALAQIEKLQKLQLRRPN